MMQAPQQHTNSRRHRRWTQRTEIAIENVLNVISDVSLQNERDNGLDSQLRYQCDFELA